MITKRLHILSATLIGAVTYYGLLGLIYAKAPYALLPAWWHDIAPTRPMSVVLWFALLNVGGALLAAIPVGLGLVLVTPAHRALSALVAGAIAAIAILVGALIEYGAPRTAAGWVNLISIFIAVCGGIAAIAMLLPSNTRLSEP